MAFLLNFFVRRNVKLRNVHEVLGQYLQYDESNLEFSFETKTVSITTAEIKAEAFQDLHHAFALRGGFIDHMSINLQGELHVSNVLLVFGPHSTDFSWEDVLLCKSRLIALLTSLTDLRSSLKKKKKKKKKKKNREKKKYLKKTKKTTKKKEEKRKKKVRDEQKSKKKKVKNY
eukprot:NODE_23174_length_677_cov_4.680000.p1 GENE.NODE_23174_length_677_cov_4.680000~~NODE_23174_length_677_cov_4.680000.p1  ORF type:complete len:173 (-),score=70.62 NODE_23174_length_677_cov_4.680000:12-530(-)